MASKTKVLCLFLLLVTVSSCHDPNRDVLSSSPSARVGTNQQSAVGQPKADESVIGSYEVKAGMLHFDNVKTYLALEDKVSKMQSDEQIAFAKKMGFTSAIKRYTEILVDLDKIRDKQQYDKFLADNKNSLSIKNGEIRPVFSSIHAALTNQESMVSIGGVIHCFLADATVIVDDGDIDKARKFSKDLSGTDESVIVLKNIKKSTAGGRIAASCSGFDQTRDSPDGKRRVRVTSGLGVDYIEYQRPPGTGRYFFVSNYSLIEGTAFKKNFWGNWVGYSTGNTLNAVYSVNISWTDFAGNPTSASFSRNQVSSNNGHVIHDKVSFQNADQVPQGGLYLFDNNRYTPVYQDSSPLSYYTSGGVPSGTPLTCP